MTVPDHIRRQRCGVAWPVGPRSPMAWVAGAFASGGRRRSELVALRMEDFADEEPVPASPTDPQSSPLPCLSLHLGRTKTTAADQDAKAYLIGYPVTALRQWLAEAGIDQWGNIDRRALNAQSVNLILKSRCPKAGLNPAQFSADGLRSGYRTEAVNQGRLSRAARLVAEPDG